MDKKKVELKAVAGKSGNQQTAKAKLEKDKLEFEV
jgi:hypothetical protein